MADGGIGTALTRREDHRFLTGRGAYVDDMNRPGQAHAALVRSPHAHAKVKSIDAKAALTAPGVVAVFTGADLEADGIGGLPCGRGITHIDMPATPHNVWRAIHQSRDKTA